jgi:hypothetical protein
MMTGVVREAAGAVSAESSGFEALLRAESAANGETTARDGAPGAALRFSGTRDGLAEILALDATLPLTSLNNCSIGISR